MTEGPARGPGNVPGVTVPLAARPAPTGHPPAASSPSPALRHPGTQMSASAVPSTLESPKGPMILDLGGATQLEPRLDVTLPSNVDDAPQGSTLRDDTARDAAIREAVSAADALASGAVSTNAPSVRHHGPATQMSPMPGASAPPGPPLAAEDAVVDAVLPSAAFLPPPPGATLDLSGGHGGDSIQHAGWGPPGAHAGAFEARDPWGGGHMPPMQPLAPARRPPRANGTLIALIAGGVVVLVVGIAIIGAGMFFFSGRARLPKRGGEPALGGGTAPGATGTPTAAPATEGAPPKAPPRVNDGPRVQGGIKAKVSELTASGVEVNGSRNAITAALPKLDGCFAASETEAPNHETTTYDLDLAPSGAVTRVEPAAAPQGSRASRLDACVVTVLRGVRLPRSASGGRVKVTLAAPIKGG